MQTLILHDPWTVNQIYSKSLRYIVACAVFMIEQCFKKSEKPERAFHTSIYKSVIVDLLFEQIALKTRAYAEKISKEISGAT